MKRLVVVLTLVFLAIVGCKQIPKRTAKTTPLPPPLPVGTSFKRFTTGDIGAGNGIHISPAFTPTDFALTSIRAKQNSVVLTWQNGTPPFQPQSKPDVLSDWVDFGPSTTQRSITNPAPYGFTKAFFRVKSTAAIPGQFQWVGKGTVNFSAAPKAVKSTPDSGVVGIGTFTGTINFGVPITGVGRESYLVKFNGNGTHAWSKRIGNTFDDTIGGVSVDASGNIIVCGDFAGTLELGGAPLVATPSPFGGTVGDSYIAKFTSAGAHIWSKSFGGNLGENAKAVATDTAGNAFFSILFGSATLNLGTTNLINAGGNTLALVKMNASGTVVWARTFPVTGTDALGLATDTSGNVLATGTFFQTTDLGGGIVVSLGGNDLFVAKYNANGTYQWGKTAGGLGSSDFGTSVATDPGTDNVLITGVCDTGSNFGNGNIAPNRGIFLASYSSPGSSLWVQFANVNPATDDFGSAVSVDNDGTVFYTGTCNRPVWFGGGPVLLGSPGCFIASITRSGGYRWAKRSGGSTAAGSGIAGDNNGFVYAGGFVENGTMFFDQTLGESGGSVSATPTGSKTPWIAKFSK